MITCQSTACLEGTSLRLTIPPHQASFAARPTAADGDQSPALLEADQFQPPPSFCFSAAIAQTKAVVANRCPRFNLERAAEDVHPPALSTTLSRNELLLPSTRFQERRACLHAQPHDARQPASHRPVAGKRPLTRWLWRPRMPKRTRELQEARLSNPAQRWAAKVVADQASPPSPTRLTALTTIPPAFAARHRTANSAWFQRESLQSFSPCAHLFARRPVAFRLRLCRPCKHRERHTATNDCRTNRNPAWAR